MPYKWYELIKINELLICNNSLFRLPVPWLLYSIVYSGFPVPVQSQGLSCSIILLLSMVLFIILAIAFFKWRLNKMVGVLFLLLYVVFVVVSILMQYSVIPCL